jgi:hypothetical protein
MPPKRRQVTWNDLNAKVSAKRTRTDGMNRGKSSASPQEIVVQKLSSEPDNKQTYRPVKPRVFVPFDYEERTLAFQSGDTVVRLKLSTIQGSWKNHDRVDSTIIQKLSISFHTPAPDIFIPCISRDGFSYFRSGWEVDKNLGGAAACFGRGLVATTRKAKENV